MIKKHSLCEGGQKEQASDYKIISPGNVQHGEGKESHGSKETLQDVKGIANKWWFIVFHWI